MEPAVGFEPTTDGLQNRCSTTELSWHQQDANSTHEAQSDKQFQYLTWLETAQWAKSGGVALSILKMFRSETRFSGLSRGQETQAELNSLPGRSTANQMINAVGRLSHVQRFAAGQAEAREPYFLAVRNHL